jgi:hypothetical protein
MYDRYFLPLLALFLLVLVRFYQDHVSARLSWMCILPMALFAAFGVAAAHDEFALNRGMEAAADELRSSGVPATAILGPQALEGWAELEKSGHLGTAWPSSGRSAFSAVDAAPAQCSKDLYFLIRLGVTPSMRPVYAVSLNPHECGGQPVLPPVLVQTWITPRMNWTHAVRLPQSLKYEAATHGQ